MAQTMITSSTDSTAQLANQVVHTQNPQDYFGQVAVLSKAKKLLIIFTYVGIFTDVWDMIILIQHFVSYFSKEYPAATLPLAALTFVLASAPIIVLTIPGITISIIQGRQLHKSNLPEAKKIRKLNHVMRVINEIPILTIILVLAAAIIGS